MQNPFEKLSSKRPPQEVEYDEWGGAFSCQHVGCGYVMNRAKYISKERLLTWQCPDGHLSKLVDVDE